MDSEQYCILEQVLQDAYPLQAFLEASQNCGFCLAKRGKPFLKKRKFIEVAHRMFQQGDLIAIDDDDYTLNDPDRFAASHFVPSRSQIEATMHREGPSIYFHASIQGATKWKQIAQPKWNQYIEFGQGGCNSLCHSGAKALDRGLIERYLTLVKQHDNLVSGSTVWQIMEPMYAEGGKALPRGYGCCF